MNFLLVNDDGISSDGLMALAEKLVKRGSVYVCAPDTQQSGMSQSISLTETVFVREAEFPYAKKAWRVNGTPADCTKIGVQMMRRIGEPLDIVFSGINKGCNLGYDTLYSGTVGAAMEGVLLGFRAIAVSVNGHDAKNFDAACDLALQSIDRVMEMEPGVVVNINTPDLPPSEIKGVRYASLGPNYFIDGFVLQEGSEYKLEGSIPDHSYLGDTIDAGANSMGYATVTPLKPNNTDWDALSEMSDWGLKL